MADEEENSAVAAEGNAQEQSGQGSSDAKEENGAGLIQSLFSAGNKLLTLPNSQSISIDDGTRRLLALFSDGRFLVVETHKFDGRVLSFQVLAKRKGLRFSKATYITQNELNAIYAYGERSAPIELSEKEVEENQLQMQRDFVNVVARAASAKVSDIHVVVADSTQIMFRVNGMMTTVMEYDGAWGEAFVRAAFASADISDSNYAQNEFQGAQKLGATPLRGSNGKLMLPHNVLAIRLQFNPIAFGSQYLVMRLLYADDNPDGSGDLSSLGFGEYEENLFYRLRSVPTGLSVVAGPTGSGKSTTLQRNMIKLLQEKNYELNLITVEDPPEYPIPGARQMPVTNANTEAEKDEMFTKALSAALRSDPDVMMVGETRSLSTAELTFKGALSGHGVWTTLHANSAPAIITRLRDMGIQKFMLADPELVKGLISQRLFRRLCPHCRKSVKDMLDHPVNILVIQALSALAAGGAILCSQYLGSSNEEGANNSARQVLFVMVILSTVLSAFCLIFRYPLLRVIFGSVEADVMQNSQVYFLFTLLSFPFIGLYDAGASIMRAQNNSRTPMVISVLSNFMNIGGNAILIFGCRMGVEGAAISTLVSRIFCAVAVIGVLRMREQTHPVKALLQNMRRRGNVPECAPEAQIQIRNYLDIRPDGATIKKILLIGIPSGIENSMFQFGKLAIQSTVSTLGTVAIAAQAMTNILENLNGIAAIGIGIGLMTVVGQCLGAGRKDEAIYYIKKLSWLSEAVIIACCLLVFALTKPITMLGGMEADSARLCFQMMIFITIVKPISWVLSFIPAYGMRAAGDVKFSMITSCCTMWLCRVSLCIYLCRVWGFGPIAVWIGMFADWSVRAIIFTIRFHSRKWLNHHVIDA